MHNLIVLLKENQSKNSLESIRNNHPLNLIIRRWNPLISLKTSKSCSTTLSLMGNHPTYFEQNCHNPNVIDQNNLSF